MQSAPPASLNASVAGDSPPHSLPASQRASRCSSPLRTRLDQPTKAPNAHTQRLQCNPHSPPRSTPRSPGTRRPAHCRRRSAPRAARRRCAHASTSRTRLPPRSRPRAALQPSLLSARRTTTKSTPRSPGTRRPAHCRRRSAPRAARRRCAHASTSLTPSPPRSRLRPVGRPPLLHARHTTTRATCRHCAVSRPSSELGPRCPTPRAPSRRSTAPAQLPLPPPGRTPRHAASGCSDRIGTWVCASTCMPRLSPPVAATSTARPRHRAPSTATRARVRPATAHPRPSARRPQGAGYLGRSILRRFPVPNSTVGSVAARSAAPLAARRALTALWC